MPAGRLGRLCSRCLLTLGLEPAAGTPADASDGSETAHRPEAEEAADSQSAVVAPSAGAAGSAFSLAALTEKPGDRIGRYKLLQQIGEGGFGAVYLAEQQEPVKRRVALKIIKLGMDTKQVVARFEAERQALAVMDHPNIAKVLDAGATTTGRPYFVMELVQGARITSYCDTHNLPTRQRLELFVQICRAIQHAHQKGIIHRDIKPSNILVTLVDGVAVPRIIDFGIAKATQAELTEQTVFTQLGQFIGTPAYMSPEQAEPGRVDIDTRSDIYSLGVLLYELLTGKTPFGATELLTGGLEEMRRAIREQEPVRPSTRLSTMDQSELTMTAQRHGVEPLRLVSLIRGDLDWIVMKCLEKDRSRRYETANGLAVDAERHLQQEPVIARPPSNLYRFQKLVRRNRVVFAAAACVALALLGGLALSTWLFLQERAGRRRAVAAEQIARQARANEATQRQQAQADQKKAEAEARKSQQVARLLTDIFNGVGPAKARGRDTTMLREILDATAKRLGPDLKDQPEVEAELRNTLGVVYLALGEYVSAGNMLRQSLALYRPVLGEENATVAGVLNNLGLALWREGNLAEAETIYRETLAIQRKLVGNEHPTVARSLNNLGIVLDSQAKLAEAEEIYREALALQRKLAGDDDPNVARFLSNLASLVHQEGKLVEAEALQRQALALKIKTLGPEHTDVARSLHKLAMVLADQGRFDEAEALQRQALAMRRKLLSEKHPDIAASLGDLAAVLRLQGKLAESETMQRQALGLKKTALGAEHDDVARSLYQLALVVGDQGRQTEAESFEREALAIRCKVFGNEDPIVANSLANLSSILRQQGRLPEAEALQREALEMRRKRLGDQHPDVAESLGELALTLRDEGRTSDAVTAARECLTRLENRPEDWHTSDARSLVGSLLLAQKEYAQAESLLLAGYQGMKEREQTIPVPDRPRLKAAAQSLVQLYQAIDQTDQAAQWTKTMADLK